MAPDREQARGSRVLPRLLTALVTGVCRRPLTTLFLALILAGLSLFATFTRLEYHTQRSDLLGPDKEYVKRWRQYLAEFGDDDDMVIVVKGDDPQRMEAALEAVAAEIAGQPQYFDRLFYKVDLRGLRSRALLYLPTEQLLQIRDRLRSMTLLLEPPVFVGLDPLFGWKSLTMLQLLHEAERRVGVLRIEAPLPEADTQFLRQLDAICRSAAAYVDDPEGYRNPWRSIVPAEDGQPDRLAASQYFFSADRKLAFLVVCPVKSEVSFTAAQNSIDALRGIVAGVRTRFPELAVGVTGLPVLENDEMVASQKDTIAASWLALAGVGLLYLVVYRSPRFPLMTVATLLIGTLWALGWLTVTVGHLNILSSAFAVMLIGMGDYGILWVTRYSQERRGGADLDMAMRRTASSVGPSIVTAAVTTALAFYAALFADFKAVAELGWIAGSGVLLCAVACFTVMPALLCLFDRRVQPNGARSLTARGDVSSSETPAIVSISEHRPEHKTWLPALNRRPRTVIAAGLALTCVLAVVAVNARYDHNLLNLQARGLESVQWEEELIARTAGASWHAVSSTATPEEALALKARYEALPEVSQVVEAASLVPAGQERKLELLRDIHKRLRRLPERGTPIPHSLPPAANVRRTLARLHSMLEILDPRPPAKVVAALGKSLHELRTRLARLDPAVAAERLRAFEERMAQDLAEDLRRLRDVSTPAPITVADLPPSLRERFVGKNGKWLLRIFARDCLWDYTKLEHFVEQVRLVDAEACGRPFSTLEGLRAMKSGFLWAAAYALLAIVSVLLLDFRNLRHTLLALVPLVMGLVAALGLMTLLGVPLNPANMIALPLILGVGADNGVHVLHDYRGRLRRKRYSLGHATGRGIMVAALTTILGFGTLMIARHRGLFGLGLMLTLGVACCMLTALVFLPAVLRLLSLRTKAAHLRRKTRLSRKAA